MVTDNNFFFMTSLKFDLAMTRFQNKLNSFNALIFEKIRVFEKKT